MSSAGIGFPSEILGFCLDIEILLNQNYHFEQNNLFIKFIILFKTCNQKPKIMPQKNEIACWYSMRGGTFFYSIVKNIENLLFTKKLADAIC